MDSKDLNNRLLFVEKRIKELDSSITSELENLKKNAGVDVVLNVTDVQSIDIDEHVELNSYIEMRNERADENYVNEIKGMIEGLPKSNGTSYYSTFDTKIAIVVDEFLYHSYENTADFYYVTPDNFKKVEEKTEVLIVVTAWKGLSNEWVGLGNPKNKEKRNKIIEVINHFKSKAKKTIFYSKEDPTNYEYFIDIAKYCDYIFTTAVEKIPQYKKDCNNNHVYLLEFGVNPLYNNPIGLNKKEVKQKILFAGSWYKKYPKRQKDTRSIFDGVINAGKDLKIIDRNYHRESENYLFPTKYLPYISPEIDHNTLQKLSKLYRWSVNLNSVQASQTMFASRIYELQSMGSLILSNYSLGVNNHFPNVFMIFNSKEVEYILNNYSEKELYQLQMFGVRKVLRNHTTFDRLSSMLKNVGFEVNVNLPKKVAVIYEKLTDNVTNNFNRQTYSKKYLVPVADIKRKFDNFDYVTFFSEDYEYGEFYLEDMINGFKYTASEFITKDSYYDGLEKVDGIENDYINSFKDYNRTLFSTANISYQELMNSNMLHKGYSIDSLELNIKRDSNKTKPSDLKFTVIIPSYNNGDHLYGKCFMSLRRSSMFEQIEIIIVDDGSTDNYTPKIVRRLERLYPNVKVYFYNDGGSGSASRPRNKGVDLATTKYVTFLDPDNEAVHDGYRKLYEKISTSDNEVVIGNIIKVDTNDRVVNYYQAVKEKYPNKTEYNKSESKDLLIETSLKVQSIQAMMMEKNFLMDNQLTMLEGVVGEDTLFFYDIIVNANSFSILDEVIHIYYAGVEGSAVNNITLNTFNKYKEIEKEKVLFFKKHNLLGAYMSLRFEYYFKNWYLKKLELVRESDREEAENILHQIYLLYSVYVSDELDDEIKEFVTKFQ